MGWIKYEKELETDPRFLRMLRAIHQRDASVTGALPEAINVTLLCGALTRFWAYADTHIRADDRLELGAAEIDAWLGVPGFCVAMPEDWLTILDDHAVELPGYQRHNGTQSRKRELAQKRQEAKRRRDSTRERDTSVTPALRERDQTRLDQTNKKRSKDLCPVETGPGPIDRVFDHWKAAWNHPRSKLDPKRRRVIANALRAYSETDLRAAISGYLNSSHHCGENERRTVYDEIGLFLRDAAHIDAGIAFGQERTDGPAKPDLRFYGEAEYLAYEAALKQGLTFSDQAEWDAYRANKTH